ncbi:MAG: hypothetical protein ACI9IA_000166 [Enterobacterales bacterium]|jgi:hypothetical protein
MPKYPLLVLTFLLIFLFLPSKLTAARSDADIFIGVLCDYAKIDYRSRIRKKLKDARLKLRKIYPSIRCEGKSFHDYAVENNSQEVVKYIETKIKPDER